MSVASSGSSSPNASGMGSTPSITSPLVSSSTPLSFGVSSAPPSSSSTFAGNGSGHVITNGASLGIEITVVAMVGSFVLTLL